MFIQVQIPRTHLTFTPTNGRYICLNTTPNRYLLNITKRTDNIQNDHNFIQMNQQKENINRIPGNSFSINSTSKELQIQIQQQTQQRDSNQYTLQEAILKSNMMEQHLDQLQSQKMEQAIQFQVNMDQFQNQINILTKKLKDLIYDNNYLQKQYLSQQCYIQELEFEEDYQFNITHNFGQM